MKVYRIVDNQYSAIEKIWDAYGARRDGGRWNLPGTSAIYTSPNLETALAEKAYYAILQNVAVYDAENTKVDRLEKVLDRTYLVVEIKIADDYQLINLTNDKELQQTLKKHQHDQSYTASDTKLSPYMDLPNRWTQKLGTKINNEKSPGLMVCSARKQDCHNYVYYPDNCEAGHFVVTSTYEVKLSAAANISFEKIQLNQSASTNKVIYEIGSQLKQLQVDEFLIT